MTRFKSGTLKWHNYWHHLCTIVRTSESFIKLDRSSYSTNNNNLKVIVTTFDTEQMLYLSVLVTLSVNDNFDLDKQMHITSSSG